MNQRWRKPCFDWLWLLAECIAKKRGSGVVYDPQNLENSSLSPHKVLTYLHLNSRARRTLVRCFPSYKLFLVFYHIILMISNIPVQHWNHVLLTVPSNVGQDIRNWLRIEAMICFRVRLHRGMSSYLQPLHFPLLACTGHSSATNHYEAGWAYQWECDGC